MDIEKKMMCYSCSKELELELDTRVLRHEECGHCGASIHCCKMCTFYDTSSYNDCRETMAQRIVDKEKANFCDHFKLADPNTKVSSAQDLLLNANALFKN